MIVRDYIQRTIKDIGLQQIRTKFERRKKMKRIIMIVGFLGVFMIFVGLSTAEVSSDGWQPFTASFTNCANGFNGEEIALTGMYKWIEQGEWLDASGGYHVLYMYMERGMLTR